MSDVLEQLRDGPAPSPETHPRDSWLQTWYLWRALRRDQLYTQDEIEARNVATAEFLGVTSYWRSAN